MATIEDFFEFPEGRRGSGAIVYGGPPLPYISSSNATNDGGTVAKLAKLLHGGITTHGSTAELIQKVMSYDSFSIVGHGNVGYFETGAGPFGNTESNGVEYQYEFTWRDEFSKLYRPNRVVYSGDGQPHVVSPGSITLYSCCTAKGQTGLNFLQRLADITNHEIIGFTGLIYVYSDQYGKPLYFGGEHGHKWIKVKPYSLSKTGYQDEAENVMDETVLAPPLSDLLNINFERTNHFIRGINEPEILTVFIELLHNKQFTMKVIPYQDWEEILKSIFYSESFPKSGGVVGILTAIVTIKYVDKTYLTLNVLSDRMAENIITGESWITAPTFRQTMEQIFFTDS